MKRRTYAGAETRTPRQAANYARSRLDRIDAQLAEIAIAYGGVDNFIEEECERLRAQVAGLRPSIDEAEREERSL
jgi:hypothetical protein